METKRHTVNQGNSTVGPLTTSSPQVTSVRPMRPPIFIYLLYLLNYIKKDLKPFVNLTNTINTSQKNKNYRTNKLQKTQAIFFNSFKYCKTFSSIIK